MRQQEAMHEVKRRAQQTIAHVQTLALLLHTSKQNVTQVLARLQALCQHVPSNVCLPKLIGELNMMLEREHCSLSYDVAGHFS